MRAESHLRRRKHGAVALRRRNTELSFLRPPRLSSTFELLAALPPWTRSTDEVRRLRSSCRLPVPVPLARAGPQTPQLAIRVAFGAWPQPRLLYRVRARS